jgi:hypothetical protein
MKYNKEVYIHILNDVKANAFPTWDWEEDYHESGLQDREDRIEWSNERVDEIIKLIESIK